MGADVANGRTCRSLAYLLSKYSGIRIIFVTPPELAPPEDLLAHLRERGVICELTEELMDAAKQANVLYWVRLQVERVADEAARERLKANYARFCIGPQQAAVVPKKALILHPMPIVNEVALQVKSNCPQFKAYEQSVNGLSVRMALLHELLKNR